MFLGEGLRMALANLWSHRMRSALTILGVIIGIASVLAVVTLGASFEEGVVSGFDAVDDRTIFVSVDQDGDVAGGPPEDGGLGRIFSDRDAAIIEAFPGVESVVVQALQPIAGFRIDGRFISFGVLNTANPESDLLSDLAGGYEAGTVFGEGAAELVFSYDVAKRLGGDESLPVGTRMELLFLDGRTDNVTLVGILAQEDNPFVQFTAGQAFAPIDRYYSFPKQESPVTGDPVRVFDGLAVLADSPRDLENLADDVEAYLSTRGSDAEGFQVEGTVILVATANDITEQIGQLFDQITLFISAIGGVSLLVGTIGIANIMLVSVTERTREIGVMKAIGAKDKEILVLFLLEAFLIGLAGAVIGIALGVAGGWAIIKSGLFGDDFPFVLPWDWLAYSVLVGIGVGVIAGFLPARRATKIQPIQALAYE